MRAVPPARIEGFDFSFVTDRATQTTAKNLAYRSPPFARIYDALRRP